MATVVPVIDLSCSFTEKSEEAKKLLDACQEWGCFRVVNHGIQEELLLDMKAVMQAIFELPDDVKHSKRAPLSLGQGYIPAGEFRPSLEIFGVTLDTLRPQAFGEFFSQLEITPQHREIIDSYTNKVNDLAEDLVMKIYCSLGLKTEQNLCNGWLINARGIKYTFTEETIDDVVLHSHTDASFITVLQEDYNICGLQVENNTGEFINLCPLPGALFVNIGDIGKAWSNGRFKNTNHRVMCKDVGTRISIVWFLMGPQLIEAPSTLIDLDHPQLYRPFSLSEYGETKLRTINSSEGDALEQFMLKQSTI